VDHELAKNAEGHAREQQPDEMDVHGYEPEANAHTLTVLDDERDRCGEDHQHRYGTRRVPRGTPGLGFYLFWL
jgi:hypothetical protein